MSVPPRVRFAEDGIEIESGLLWLDARKPRGFGLITHAHADHVGRHRTMLCTPETAAFVRKRTGAGGKFLEKRYGETTPVGDLQVTLLPAGHILGSAMALIEGPGGRLLYTGDFRLEGGLTCPPARPERADHLITEATFGLPRHRLPPPAEVRAELAEFAGRCLAQAEIPVFLAYALGKAQEVMAILAQAGHRVAAHGSAWNLCRLYRRFGVRFPRSRRLDGGLREEAVVVPPRFLPSIAKRTDAPLRVAAVTGWNRQALGPRVERAFPLSDHADYDGLVRLVEQVAPSRVSVLHGYAAEFAADLRERGYRAEAVPGHSGPDEETRPGMFDLA